MEEYQGVAWAAKEELADLVSRKAIDGPFDTQRLTQGDGFLRRGIIRCYREAARISHEKGYDFVVARRSTEVGRTGDVDVEFYRFKQMR